MATAISGFLHVARHERTAGFLYKVPKLLHFRDALNGQSDNLGPGFYPKSFLGALKGAFINKNEICASTSLLLPCLPR
jgi:hypothetical protein